MAKRRRPTGAGQRRRRSPATAAAAQGPKWRRPHPEGPSGGGGSRGGGGLGSPNRPSPCYSSRAYQACGRPQQATPRWAAQRPAEPSRHRPSPTPLFPLQNCNKTPKTLSIYVLDYSVLHIYFCGPILFCFSP